MFSRPKTNLVTGTCEISGEHYGIKEMAISDFHPCAEQPRLDSVEQIRCNLVWRLQRALQVNSPVRTRPKMDVRQIQYSEWLHRNVIRTSLL